MENNYLLGKKFLKEKKYEKAIHYFLKDTKKNIKNKEYLFTDLGYTYLELNQNEKALFYLNKAIDVKKDFLYANYNKAVILNKMKRYDESYTITNNMIKLYPNYNQFYYQGALSLYNQEIKKEKWNFNQTIYYCDKYIEKSDNPYLGNMLKGMIYYDLKQHSKGKKLYNKGLLLNPNLINLNQRINFLKKNIKKASINTNKIKLYDNEYLYISSILENRELLNKTLQLLIFEIERKYKTEEISNVDGWQSPRYINILQPSIYENKQCIEFLEYLELFILMSLNNYYQSKNNIYYEIQNIWANINRKNAYNNIHNHGINTVSGCYYVNSGYTDKKNTPLIFYDNDRSPITIESLGEAGTLGLWNSEIYHSVPKHNGDKERISIAFNINVVIK